MYVTCTQHLILRVIQSLIIICRFLNSNSVERMVDAAAFRSKFYHMDELVSNPNISPADYKTLYPLFVFDVSKQSERLKTSVTDIQIKTQFNVNVPVGTEAFAIVISDKLVNFQSDGNKMSVVY